LPDSKFLGKVSNAASGGTIIDPQAIMRCCVSGIAARKATLLERSLERVFRKAGDNLRLSVYWEK